MCNLQFQLQIQTVECCFGGLSLSIATFETYNDNVWISVVYCADEAVYAV